MTADTEDLRKNRGAFFTPPEICEFIVQWAIRSPSDRLLEPSCGEAAFLLAAVDRLRDLEAERPRAGQLTGVEIHRASAGHARRQLTSVGAEADIREADFLRARLRGRFDAVIGNPPYIRYQQLPASDRAKAREIAIRHGVALTGLTSSWAGFVLRSAELLAPDGRLGLVLPAELLTVNYAADLRSFLMRRFAHVRLVVFKARVFPGVTEEVVLLLAEGTGGTDHLEVYQAEDVDDLQNHSDWAWLRSAARPRWSEALVGDAGLAAYDAVAQAAGVMTTLGGWGDPTLGMVTGNNGWFALTKADVDRLRLGDNDVIAISPPGSKHLNRLAYTRAQWSQLRDDGRRVYLFRPSSPLSAAARRRVAAGESGDIHTAYKCRARTPWWRVPLVAVPDLFVTYMNSESVRLVANQARHHHVNSVHGLRLHPAARRLGTKLLPLAALNSVTLLGAELVGRAYGGGLLKLEPKEAERLPVPSPLLLLSVEKALTGIRAEVDEHLRARRFVDAVQAVDRVVLSGQLGLSGADVQSLRDARQHLRGRRHARHKGAS